MVQFDLYENPNLASLAAGTRLVVIDRGDEVVIKTAEPFAATSFESIDAPSVYKGRRLSITEMDRAIGSNSSRFVPQHDLP